MRDIVLIRCGDRRALDRVVERSLELVGADGVEVWRHARAGLALLQATATDAVETVAIHQTPDEAFSYTGFVADEAFAPADVRRLVSLDGNPVMSRSPGGIATYFLADARRRRIAAWSSLAGLEGPYYSPGRECTAISNRPLLAHQVARQSDGAVFSQRWARRLLAGPGMWDDTPFADTWQPPPRTAIVAGDAIRFAPHPLAPSRLRYGKRDPAGVDALCVAGLAAVAPLARWPRGTLHLSGGKDSRLAAALVRRAGVAIDLVTHARPGAGESEAAAAAARALRLDHRLTDAAGIAEGDELLPTILGNLRRADGLLSEPRHLAYPPALAGGEPLVEGQGHGIRGGLRVTLVPKEAIRPQLALGGLGDHQLVADELVEERRARTAELLDGYRVQHPLELPYWLGADWRVTRGMTGSYRALARARPVVFPMMDERVLEVCGALTPGDRALEITFYAALCRLAPELAPVPLYEDIWRFDNGPMGASEFPDGHEERRRPFHEQGRGRTAERRFETIQPLFRRAAFEFGFGSELRRLIRPECLRAMCDEGDPALALGRPHMQIINFMWRVVAVTLVVEGSWS